MSNAVASHRQTPIVRPLHILVPLIKKDLQQASEAAERAAEPYYKAAGEKMLEAKGQVSSGDFVSWVERNFNVGERQAQRYMQYANATRNMENRPQGSPLPSFNQFRRDQGERASVYPQPWHEPVKKTLNKVDVETLNIRREELKRAEEREAQKQLALQLIDIGYKTLATKLHPDKGGSREAMARLNQVRDRLKASA